MRPPWPRLGRKPSGWCFSKRQRRGVRKRVHGEGRGHVKPEAAIGAMQLRPRSPGSHRELGEGAGRSPESQGQHGAASASLLNFRLSEQRGNEFSVVLSQVYGNLLRSSQEIRPRRLSRGGAPD